MHISESHYSDTILEADSHLFSHDGGNNSFCKHEDNSSFKQRPHSKMGANAPLFMTSIHGMIEKNKKANSLVAEEMMRGHADSRAGTVKDFVPSLGETTSFKIKGKSYRFLTAQEEIELCGQWQKNKDRKALERLLDAFYPFLQKIVKSYAGYKIDAEDLLSEAQIGFITAVGKYNPSEHKNARLMTYASWWIKASLREYAFQNKSILKMSGNHDTKLMFFKMNEIFNKYKKEGKSHYEIMEKISLDYNIPMKKVEEFHYYMQPVSSLNSFSSSDNSNTLEIIDSMPSDDDVHHRVETADYVKKRNQQFARALSVLSSRERDIIRQRYLIENTVTLDVLAISYKITRERIRQIEASGIKKIKQYLKKHEPSLSI